MIVVCWVITRRARMPRCWSTLETQCWDRSGPYAASFQFSPDATRSGLFLSRHDGLSDEVSEISSVGSEDEDDADLFEEEKAVEDVGGRWQPNDIPDGFVYFRHLSSRCIHKTLNESGSLFACGRSISTRYERQAERPKFFHPLCGSCFKDYHA